MNIAEVAEKYSRSEEALLEYVRNHCFHELSKPLVNSTHVLDLIRFVENHDLDLLSSHVTGVITNADLDVVLNIDGWVALVNNHKSFDGVEFEYSEAKVTVDVSGYTVTAHEWIDTIIYRKDRSKPIKAREFLTENVKDFAYWLNKTNRVLRHKSYVQCARLAFGLGELKDWDEVEIGNRKEDSAKAVNTTFEVQPTPLDNPASIPEAVNTRSDEKIDESQLQIMQFVDKILPGARKQNVLVTARNHLSSKYTGDELAFAQRYFDSQIQQDANGSQAA